MEDLEKKEKLSQFNKEYYKKHKPRLQIYKKFWSKKNREESMKILGNKCASCGEPYNPHARISNLQFDHKFYIHSKSIHKSIASQIQEQVKHGVDPNIQFMLLCNVCHRIVTFVRKDQTKAKYALDLISKLEILK